MNLTELNAMRDATLNRKERRAKGKKLGIYIPGSNIPMKSTKVVTSKKSKWHTLKELKKIHMEYERS